MTDALAPDFIADGQPFENPTESADTAYAATTPSLGAKLGADFGDGLTAALGRAGQRGQVAGASFFDRLAATPDIDTAAGMVAGGQNPYPEPPPSPTISAEEANKRFAPSGTTITDGPMTEDLARVVGQQKADEVRRDSVLSRFAAGHGFVANTATGLLLSPLMDPVGSAALFVPGIGEEAVAAQLGEGLVARTASRAVAGASAAAAGMGLAGAAKYALGTEQASDYSIRQAMYDMAGGAALGAFGHAGFGALREAGILRPDGLMQAERARADAGLSPAEAPTGLVSDTDLGAVVDAPAGARFDAMNASVAQMLDGRQVDVAPIFDQVRADRAEADLRRWTAQQGQLDAQSAAALQASSVADVAAGTIESRAGVLQKRLDDLHSQRAGFLSDIEAAEARRAGQVDDVTPARLQAIDAELGDAAIPAARRAMLENERALLTEGRDPAADALEAARTEAELRGLQRGAAAVQAEMDRTAAKVDPLQASAAARRAAGSDALQAASDRIAGQEDNLRSLAARSIRRYAGAFGAPVTRAEADALAARALRGGSDETAKVVAEIRGRAVQAAPVGSPAVSNPVTVGKNDSALSGPPIAQQRAAISADVVRQLVAAGRPEAEARAAGRIVAAHYESRASRFGGRLGTAEELYRARAAEIRGPEDDGAPVLPPGGAGPAGGSAAAPQVYDRASIMARFADGDGRLDMGRASDAVRAEVADALDQGRPVTYHVEGRSIPIVSGEGGRLVDDRGQAWGLFPILQPRPGFRDRIEIGPARDAALAPSGFDRVIRPESEPPAADLGAEGTSGAPETEGGPTAAPGEPAPPEPEAVEQVAAEVMPETVEPVRAAVAAEDEVGGASQAEATAEDPAPGVYGPDNLSAWKALARFASLDELHGASGANQEALGAIARQVAEDVGVRWVDPGIKTRESAERKFAVKRYDSVGHMTDLVRGGFGTPAPIDADTTIARLAQHFPLIDEGWNVTPAGYMDRKAIIRFPNGQLGEIQFWHPDLFNAKEFGGGHALYEEARKLSPGDPKAAELDAAMQRLYGDVIAQLPVGWKELSGKAGQLGNLALKASGESVRADMPTSAELTGSQEPLTNAQASPGLQNAGLSSQEQGTGAASAIDTPPASNIGAETSPSNEPLRPFTPEADAAAEPRGKDQPAGVFMFDPLSLLVDAERFQFKSGGDEQGVTSALRGVTRWDPAKAQTLMVWEDGAGRLFVADGHQRAGLARRLTEQGQASGIQIPGILYRERDGITSDDIRAIAAVTNIANGSGSALDGAKVLRARPDLLDGSLPLSAGKGEQAAALARLGDEAFRMVVNDVVPEHFGAVVGQVIPDDPARQVAALKAIARFAPRSVEEATALSQRVASAELARADEGRQASLFGDLDEPESTAGEEIRIVARVIRELRRDRGLFSRVVANAGRLEQAGSTIARDAARTAATDAGAFSKILSADAYSAGPTRTALIDAARNLRDGRTTIGDAAARLYAAVRRQAEENGPDRLGARGGAGASQGDALGRAADLDGGRLDGRDGAGSAGDRLAGIDGTGDKLGSASADAGTAAGRGAPDDAGRGAAAGTGPGRSGGAGERVDRAGRARQPGREGDQDAAPAAGRGDRRAPAGNGRDGFGELLGRLIDDGAERLDDRALNRGAEGERSIVDEMNELLGRTPSQTPRTERSLEDEMAALVGRSGAAPGRVPIAERAPAAEPAAPGPGSAAPGADRGAAIRLMDPASYRGPYPGDAAVAEMVGIPLKSDVMASSAGEAVRGRLLAVWARGQEGRLDQVFASAVRELRATFNLPVPQAGFERDAGGGLRPVSPNEAMLRELRSTAAASLRASVHPDLIPAGEHVIRRVAGTSDGRTYTIHPRPEGGLAGVEPGDLGDPLGFATLGRHDDGRWEVGNVHVGPPFRRQGLARKLYAAIERDLGITMRPSGHLLPDGYAMWRARDPEAVKWHQEVEGAYLSPKALRDAAAETGGEESAFYRELFDKLPPEARTPKALRTMFQRTPEHDLFAAILAELDRAEAERGPAARAARPMSETGIVDPDAPMWRLYHGTGAAEDFSRFDPAVEGRSTSGAERGALFMSPRPNEAAGYATSDYDAPARAAGARMFPLDVRPGNTAVYNVGRLAAERDPRFMAASRAEFDANYGSDGTGKAQVYADALRRFDSDVIHHEDLKQRLGPDHGLPDYPTMSNLLNPQAAAIRLAREDGRDTAIIRGLGESAGGDQVVALRSGFVHSAIDPEHLFFQGAGGRAKGSITFREGARPLVQLMRDADASTFVHEMGHDWLEQMVTDAAHPDAPEAFRADAAAVRTWLGNDGDTLTEGQHETFARGFEQYLRNGVAPAPELAGAFAQFRDWLTRIYRTLRGLGAEISPDIREVFDRLLTPEQPPPAAPARPDVAALARQQQAVYRVGYAPGLPQAEFDALNTAVYGPKPAGDADARASAPAATSAARDADPAGTRAAGTPARTAADATLAAWQQRFQATGVVPSAEERALIDDTAARLRAADLSAEGYAQAGECLTAAGI